MPRSRSRPDVDVSRRRAHAQAGRLQPALERGQVHAGRGQGLVEPPGSGTRWRCGHRHRRRHRETSRRWRSTSSSRRSASSTRVRVGLALSSGSVGTGWGWIWLESQSWPGALVPPSPCRYDRPAVEDNEKNMKLLCDVSIRKGYVSRCERRGRRSAHAVVAEARADDVQLVIDGVEASLLADVVVRTGCWR